MAKQAKVAVGSEGTKKPVLIGIGIVAVLLVIAGGFFYFMKPGQTAGQAVNVGFVGPKDVASLVSEGYYGGAEQAVSLPKKNGEMITIPIWVYVPANKESVEYSFKIYYNPTVLEYVQTTSELASDWGIDFFDSSKLEGSILSTITVSHATINYLNSLKGGEGGKAYRLATVTFQAKEDFNDALAISKAFGKDAFSDFKLYDLSDPSVNLVDGKKFLTPLGQPGCAFKTCALGDFTPSDIQSALKNGQFSLVNYVTLSDMNDLCKKDQFKSYCKQEGGVAVFDVDLDGDGSVGASDAQVVFGVDGARLKKDCGAGGKDTSKNPCNIAGVYFCDDGSFRLSADYKSESCPFNPARVKK